ncbi:hypothetical protein [Alkalicoccobacillus gibsonii]|uniref:hypothetical protein n=1 Tax=Alkalicoccobacillus gibsonii TaxID=79881 RepID=UPI001933909E|nr:hypothetical protein [Alkalicoccobacillus gibsonii]MBM0064798.1 hypothetical protein [Alkalicoccobacillus gibsonii]
MFKSKEFLIHSFLLISCTVLLAACSGGQSSLSQGNSSSEQPSEVTLEALDESSFDYETLYADDFEVTNNFKYKEYPVLDIDKIDLDRVNENLLAFIVADLGLEEDEDTNTEETNNEISEDDKDVAVVEQDDEVEEVANEESDNPEAAENESTELDEAMDEIVEDEGWVEGKGYTWATYTGGEVTQITVDPTTKKSPEDQTEFSGSMSYAPLLPDGGLCPAEYCIPPSDLPSTAFFGNDGSIYDTEYAGTWEYYITDEQEWTWYAWNNN